MTNFLLFLILAIFAALLFLNIYFRVKVFKVYKRLVQNRVDFKAVHFLNKERLETEILPKYPAHKADILTFMRHIRFSVSLASILVALSTAFCAILIFM